MPHILYIRETNKNVFSSSEKAAESGDLTKKTFLLRNLISSKRRIPEDANFFLTFFFEFSKLSLRFIRENAR